MTNEQKVAKINELQRLVFGTIDEIIALMDNEVLTHCEKVLDESDWENSAALQIGSFSDDLHDYSRNIPVI